MKTVIELIIVTASAFVVFCLGYFAAPEAVWDIGLDPRDCIVFWDDNTASIKADGDIEHGIQVIFENPEAEFY